MEVNILLMTVSVIRHFEGEWDGEDRVANTRGYYSFCKNKTFGNYRIKSLKIGYDNYQKLQKHLLQIRFLISAEFEKNVTF